MTIKGLTVEDTLERVEQALERDSPNRKGSPIKVSLHIYDVQKLYDIVKAQRAAAESETNHGTA